MANLIRRRERPLGTASISSDRSQNVPRYRGFGGAAGCVRICGRRCLKPLPQEPAVSTALDGRKRWLALYRAVPRRADDRARHDRRDGCAAVHPGGPRVFRDLAVVGAERVLPHLRRLSVARWSARRPVRTAAAVPAGRRPVHAGLARLRAVDGAGAAGHRARGAGPGRGGGHGRGAVADRESLPRERRAREGDGHLRLRLRGRRQHRRSARAAC